MFSNDVFPWLPLVLAIWLVPFVAYALKSWLRGVDISCAGMWNTALAYERAGTEISRRHGIDAVYFDCPSFAQIIPERVRK